MSRGQLPRTREFFPRTKDRRIGRYVRRYRNWRPRFVLGVNAIGHAAETAGQQLLVLAESIEDAFAVPASTSQSAPSPRAPGRGHPRAGHSAQLAYIDETPFYPQPREDQ
ncbi:hypothetical protein [Arthrobacter woluwensis]|uniref:hypothetical protein n=1 Tax=Arthrobacter woluwensis TaxID=156980 RepID=UPI0037F3068D